MHTPTKAIKYEIYVHAALEGMGWPQKTAWAMLRLPGLVKGDPSLPFVVRTLGTHSPRAFNRYAPSIIDKPKDVEALIEAVEILKQIPQETITQCVDLFGDHWDKRCGAQKKAKEGANGEEPPTTHEPLSGYRS